MKQIIKELLKITGITEIICFIGLTLNKIGEDLNLVKTTKFGITTFTAGLLFATANIITTIIIYDKEKKNENNKTKQPTKQNK